eukprot:COSAG06_NODE_3887_length_4803_cov_2.841199_5_plen_298_part_00
MALLLEDGRILGRVSQLLGGRRCLWTGSELNSGTVDPGMWEATPAGSQEHGWHSDRPGVSETSYPRIKVVMYLTPTTASTGALRCLPGSHRASFHERLLCLDQAHGVHTSDPRWQAATFGVQGEQLPGFAIESNPGDVIMFHHSIYHAVYGHQPGRTFLAMKLAARPELPLQGAAMGEAERKRGERELASLLRFSGSSVFSPHSALVTSSSAAVRDLVAGLDLATLALAQQAAAASRWEAEELQLPGYVDATALMPFGDVPPRIMREDRFDGGVDTHLNAMAELSAQVGEPEGKSKL